jgi:hypothetical protein
MLYLELPNRTAELIRYPAPQPDMERPVLFDEEVSLEQDITARIVVRRSAEPLPAGFSRATRLGGLVIRSGRSAHETTLAGFEGGPGSRHLYGEVFCDAIDLLQRNALDSPRPQLVVKVDRSGLNEHHPLVKSLYSAISRVLRPIVADEERRAGAHLIGTPRAVTARDRVGLRALNDVLKAAFESPGRVAAFPGTAAVKEHPTLSLEREATEPVEQYWAASEEPSGAVAPLYFRQSPIRLHPGERRRASLVADPAVVVPGTEVEVESDPGLNVTLSAMTVPAAGSRGYSSIRVLLRARASAEPGARLVVLAAAGESTCELEVLIVRHRASGWVKEIARKSEDQVTEAEFDPETGVVTVYEGRREFRALERAARRAGYRKGRITEYVPHRMLEVEAAANAVYEWAARQILNRRLPEERPSDPAEYAAAVHHEAQALRHTAHYKLMQAFLEPEVFEGAVGISRPPASRRMKQLSLIE